MTPTRFALTIAALLGCGGPTLAPVSDPSVPLCARDAVAVRTSPDDAVARVFGRVREVVARDALGTRPRPLARSVVAVTGPPGPREGRYALAWVCGPTIVLHVNAITSALASDEPDELLARIIAHELVHILLRHEASDAEPVRKEYEAYLLGAWYLERAGFDCRRWQRHARDRASRVHEYDLRDRSLIEVEHRAVELGCDLAKRGVKPLRDVVLPPVR